MAELLVMARESHSWAPLSVSDPEKAVVGCWRKGDIVSIREDGGPWGTKCGLPSFIKVKVTGATKAQVIDYMSDWNRTINFTVLLNNHPNYNIRMTANIESVSEIEGLTKAKVKRWLKTQEADIIDHGTNYVDVAITLDDGETLNDRKQEVLINLGMVKRRKWHFSESDVDNIIAAGGEITVTKNQAQNAILSKLVSVDGN